MLAVLAAARDRNGLRVRVDAVLDELGDRLQRVPRRERDDTDRVPVIADPELAAIGGLFSTLGDRYVDAAGGGYVAVAVHPPFANTDRLPEYTIAQGASRCDWERACRRHEVACRIERSTRANHAGR